MRIKHTVLALALAATFGAASAAEPAKESSAAAAKAAKDASAELERARAEFKDAEAKMRESARRLAELSAKAGGDDRRNAYAYRYFTEPRRAMIGIVIGDDEVQGVYIAGVTPGAPAARAGVKAGDKLVAVNGKAVPAGAPAEGKVARAARGEDGTRIAREMIGELEAGQKVKLTVERAGKRLDFDLAAEQREASELPMWVGEFDHDIDVDVDVHIDPAQIERDVRVIVDKGTAAAAKAGAMARPQLGQLKHLTEGMHELLYLSDGNFTNLRMGSLNPDLGRYFGADSGVLVLENKGQRVPELKAGDVITTVAGKRVNTPSEVMRALRSGTPGASVNVEILRDKKRQIVALDVPEHGPLLLPLPPEPPEPPTPPAPPAQPAPPTPPTPPPTPRAAPPLPPEPPSPPTPPPPPRETVAFGQVI